MYDKEMSLDQTAIHAGDGLAIQSKAARWRGAYKGVAFEVSAHAFTKPDGSLMDRDYGYETRTWCWCYYIRLNEGQVPEEAVSALATEVQEGDHGRRWRRYSSLMEELERHGGLTYYEIEGGLDGQPRVFVGGFNFNHLWDEGQNYNLNDVVFEVRKTVDDLRERVPDLRWPCPIIGGYHAAEDGEFREDGSFVSAEGLAWHEEYYGGEGEGEAEGDDKEGGAG